MWDKLIAGENECALITITKFHHVISCLALCGLIRVGGEIVKLCAFIAYILAAVTLFLVLCVFDLLEASYDIM